MTLVRHGRGHWPEFDERQVNDSLAEPGPRPPATSRLMDFAARFWSMPEPDPRLRDSTPEATEITGQIQWPGKQDDRQDRYRFRWFRLSRAPCRAGAVPAGLARSRRMPPAASGWRREAGRRCRPGPADPGQCPQPRLDPAGAGECGSCREPRRDPYRTRVAVLPGDARSRQRQHRAGRRRSWHQQFRAGLLHRRQQGFAVQLFANQGRGRGRRPQGDPDRRHPAPVDPVRTRGRLLYSLCRDCPRQPLPAADRRKDALPAHLRRRRRSGGRRGALET